MQRSSGENVKKNYISLKVGDAMYDLVAAEADKRNLPLNETIVDILGEWFEKPEAAYVPRNRLGRPRKNGKKRAS